jgi:hypothetical protein
MSFRELVRSVTHRLRRAVQPGDRLFRTGNERHQSAQQCINLGPLKDRALDLHHRSPGRHEGRIVFDDPFHLLGRQLSAGRKLGHPQLSGIVGLGIHSHFETILSGMNCRFGACSDGHYPNARAGVNLNLAFFSKSF